MSLPLGCFARLAIEVLDQRRAVVLLDEVDDRLGDVVLPRQVGAVFDVRDDDQRAHGRHQRSWRLSPCP